METTGMRSEAYEQSLAYTRGISVEEFALSMEAHHPYPWEDPGN